MKQIHSILSFTLALLVLFSASSFTIGIHLCCGEVQEVSLLAKATGCGNEQSLPPCHLQKKVSCCEDKTIVHDGQGFKTSLIQGHIAPTASVDIHQPLIAEVIPATPLAQIEFFHYDPPLRTPDLTVALQVFLI